MLLDKFKKIIKSEKKETVKEKKPGKVVARPEVKKAVSKSKVTKTPIGFVYEIIKRPVITEKGAMLGQGNKYLMKVSSHANKVQIKKSMSVLYNVTVTSVNIVNIPDKKKQRGKNIGYKSGFKKAIVTLKEGDKIEFA